MSKTCAKQLGVVSHNFPKIADEKTGRAATVEDGSTRNSEKDENEDVESEHEEIDKHVNNLTDDDCQKKLVENPRNSGDEKLEAINKKKLRKVDEVDLHDVLEENDEEETEQVEKCAKMHEIMQVFTPNYAGPKAECG